MTSDTTSPAPAPALATAAGSGPEPAIRVQRVSRWFGSVVAVNDVTFDISPGVTGLVGPNGAGKTTLLRMLSGLARPSEGTITAFGEPVRGNPDIYKRIGVMTAHEQIYSFMTGRQFVELAAVLTGVPDVKAATDRAIDMVRMSESQDRKMGGYSRGMRQRMRLAHALVHDPEILLLDEPLSGTDPRQRLEFMDVIAELARRGRTILVSSHILEEVETMADRILLIVGGKLAASGDYRAIRRRLNQRPYLVRVDCDQPRALAAALAADAAVESLTIDDLGVRVLGSDVRALQRAIPVVARTNNVRLQRVQPLDDSLESVFEYLAESASPGTRAGLR
jgi:ABC-2 type transport system ATP-binding protein